MSSAAESGTLHILVGPGELSWPAWLLPVLARGDSVLLMQEAVWLALDGVAIAPARLGLPDRVSVYVLGADLQARGLSARALNLGIQQIDDHGWVELSERHQRVLTWGGR